MQIAYNAKYAQLVCVVLLSSIFCSAAQNCGENKASTEFQNNLKIVLDNLVDNTSSSNGFSTSSYGRSPDTVYGLLQCMADTTAEECLSCSQNASSSIFNACKNVTSGSSMDRGKCFIRYENYSFFGELDTSTQVVYNMGNVTDRPEEFKAAVRELFKNLSENALQSPKKYSSGSKATSSARGTFNAVNGQLQCWRDLTSVDDCNTCLRNAIRQLLDVTFASTNPSQGGACWSGSCIARYEIYSFFNPSPPPPSPNIQPPPSPNIQPAPTTKNSSNKIGMAVGISGGLLVMLLLCMLAIQRKLKSGALWKPAILRKGNLDSELDSEIGKEPGTIFNLEDIKAATSNFHEDNKLGEGGFGSVYKVYCVLNLEKRKLLRFLRDGWATMFIYEMQNGYELASVLDNQMAFDEALAKLMQEIQNSKNPSVDNLQIFHQLLQQKKAIWMEGPLGWTSWVNKFEDVSL